MNLQIVESSQNYVVIQRYGHRYVVRKIDRLKNTFPNPNFMGSGMALRGILKAGETIKEFIKRDKLKTLRPIEKPN